MRDVITQIHFSRHKSLFAIGDLLQIFKGAIYNSALRAVCMKACSHRSIGLLSFVICRCELDVWFD